MLASAQISMEISATASSNAQAFIDPIIVVSSVAIDCLVVVFGSLICRDFRSYLARYQNKNHT